MCPDHRQHRGSHPADKELFATEHVPALRRATADLSWLLTNGYVVKSALKLVGDRFNLTERQRLAVARAAASDEQCQYRREHCLPFESIHNEEVLIDGFNLIITVEAALSGGLLIHCRDECIRDLSSVHGSYRAVSETEAAIHLIGEILMAHSPRSVTWLLDQPISNSGRLAQRIRDIAHTRGWPWNVSVVMNPDNELRASERIVLTSDSFILDGVARWVNFTRQLVDVHLRTAWIIDLSR